MKSFFRQNAGAGFTRNYFSPIKNNSGFTLIEVIIATFSAVLILAAFVLLFLLHNSLYYQQQATVKTSEGLRQALQTMQFYANQSYRVMDNHTFNGVLYQSGPDTLVLQLPAIDTQTNILSGKWDYAVFYLSSGKLLITTEKDAASARPTISKMLADNVNSFQLTYDNADFALVRQVTAVLQTQVLVKGKPVTTGVSQNINILNY